MNNLFKFTVLIRDLPANRLYYDFTQFSEESAIAHIFADEPPKIVKTSTKWKYWLIAILGTFFTGDAAIIFGTFNKTYLRPAFYLMCLALFLTVTLVLSFIYWRQKQARAKVEDIELFKDFLKPGDILIILKLTAKQLNELIGYSSSLFKDFPYYIEWPAQAEHLAKKDQLIAKAAIENVVSMEDINFTELAIEQKANFWVYIFSRWEANNQFKALYENKAKELQKLSPALWKQIKTKLDKKN